MEESKIAQMLLAMNNMPGYKVHPLDTYNRFLKKYSEEIRHPKEIYFFNDLDKMRELAKSILLEHKLKFASTGIATGMPGGPAAAGTTVIDLEEYLRRLIRMSQEIGQVYGLIPNPFSDQLDNNSASAETQEQIFKAILIGLGVGGTTMGIAEIAKMLATKEAKEIVSKRIDEKILTQLAKQIAKILGQKISKEGVAKIVEKFVPVIGGIINGTLNYFSIGKIGDNLIKNFEAEYILSRPGVIKYWNEK